MKMFDMKSALLTPVRQVAASMLLLTVVACDSGPKTYDDCMLQASRSAESDRQFKTRAQTCKDRFGHTLPLRAPPTAPAKGGDAAKGSPAPAQRP